MIENSLSTLSVTKQINQTDKDQSSFMTSYINFGSKKFSHSIELRHQNSGYNNSTITQETISTLDVDFVRFNKILSTS